MKFFARILYPIEKVFSGILSGIIHLYRLFLSPVLGNNCRFHPTCSTYALEALKSKRLPTALLLIVKRVSRCHPYHEGGYDPVP